MAQEFVFRRRQLCSQSKWKFPRQLTFSIKFQLVCVLVSCFLRLLPQLRSYVVVVALKSSSRSSIRQSRFFPSLISNNINTKFGCCLERFEQASECLCAKSSCRETAGKHRTIFHERLLADFRGRVQMSRGKYANVIIPSVSNDSGVGECAQSIQLALTLSWEFFLIPIPNARCFCWRDFSTLKAKPASK